MNTKQIRLKMGTMIAIATASIGRENWGGTPQTWTSELAPMKAGIELIRIRKLCQGSLTIRASTSIGTIIGSRLIRRRERQQPNPKPKKHAINTKFLK